MASRPSTSAHRSMQEVPLRDRQHLHDGLRFMPADMAKTNGWHIPNTTFQRLLDKADNEEDKLYRGRRGGSGSARRVEADLCSST